MNRARDRQAAEAHERFMSLHPRQMFGAKPLASNDQDVTTPASLAYLLERLPRDVVYAAVQQLDRRMRAMVTLAARKLPPAERSRRARESGRRGGAASMARRRQAGTLQQWQTEMSHRRWVKGEKP